MGKEALADGNMTLALDRFLTALVADPQRARYRRKAFDVLGFVDGYGALPLPVVVILEDIAADTTIEPQPISRIAKNLLSADVRYSALQHTLDQEPDVFAEAALNGHLDWILGHGLLITALRRTIIADEKLEHDLTRIRRNLILAPALKSSQIAERYSDFLLAMARHCVVTRHMWNELPDEKPALSTLVDTGQLPLHQIAILKCCYYPLETLSLSEQSALPDLLKNILKTRTHEAELAATLPQITSISAGLSQAMQSQYECFPYPTWDHRKINAQMSWPEFLARVVPQQPYPTPKPEIVDILIAGCGTGRYALQLAQRLPGARIRAFDLSRVSLGYAAHKAEEYGVHNLLFGVADIRMLADLPKRFHFIECSGVLHHMANPAEGLRALTGLLTPGGILYLSLYSERARQHVSMARQFVSTNEFSDDVEGLRAARAAIFSLPQSHPVRQISETVDFYSADGIHDLLFNIHECAFTPLSLKELVDKSGLKFLGFELQNPADIVEFRTANPSEELARNLDQWEEFEKSHPKIFVGMFQIWLQKPAE